MTNYKINPNLDLVLERTVEISPELIWKAWTTPETMSYWFCPAPWTVKDCKVDLKAGGLFQTIMVSPEGEEFKNDGCYLELIKNRKLVWTNALLPGFRPAEKPLSEGVDFQFTAMVIMKPEGTGTKYTAIALHQNEADKKKHEKMGFHEGWGICLDQLITYVNKKNMEDAQ